MQAKFPEPFTPIGCKQCLNKEGFSIQNIIFEVSEMEKVHDESRLVKIFSYYKQKGFQTAIDDFGAGYSGLKLLSRFIPDYIKIDMELIRNINGDDKKFKIVESIFELGNKLNIQVIAEGVETIQEYRTLKEMGLYLFQGYLIAKPGFETLPTVTDSFSN